ncbi:MAG: hypothetical protein KKA19_09990 [Candidatus Margulisbacteria bacterium]|nr:hypothetical protein [Candidatus Margulisiibacteriota bacterium]
MYRVFQSKKNINKVLNDIMIFEKSTRIIEAVPEIMTQVDMADILACLNKNQIPYSQYLIKQLDLQKLTPATQKDLWEVLHLAVKQDEAKEVDMLVQLSKKFLARDIEHQIEYAKFMEEKYGVYCVEGVEKHLHKSDQAAYLKAIAYFSANQARVAKINTDAFSEDELKMITKYLISLPEEKDPENALIFYWAYKNIGLADQIKFIKEYKLNKKILDAVLENDLLYEVDPAQLKQIITQEPKVFLRYTDKLEQMKQFFYFLYAHLTLEELQDYIKKSVQKDDNNVLKDDKYRTSMKMLLDTLAGYGIEYEEYATSFPASMLTVADFCTLEAYEKIMRIKNYIAVRSINEVLDSGKVRAEQKLPLFALGYFFQKAEESKENRDKLADLFPTIESRLALKQLEEFVNKYPDQKEKFFIEAEKKIIELKQGYGVVICKKQKYRLYSKYGSAVLKNQITQELAEISTFKTQYQNAGIAYLAQARNVFVNEQEAINFCREYMNSDVVKASSIILKTSENTNDIVKYTANSFYTNCIVQVKGRKEDKNGNN